MKAVFFYLLLFISIGGIITYLAIDNNKYKNAYNDDVVEVYYDKELPQYDLKGYHKEHAVLGPDEEVNADFFRDNTISVLFVNDTDKEVIVAHNALKRIYPASMTKLMTAIVVCEAIERGDFDLDQEVKWSNDIIFERYPDAMHSGFEKGYSVSLRNLLYGYLMCSYNDFGVKLAELVAGSESEFCKLMNDKAYQIGATNCHFVNTHGLHDNDHYITAYDMYLIINEASKHQLITEIDSHNTYPFFFKNAKGEQEISDIYPTNGFLNGWRNIPEGVSIHEWKTGTTGMAGYCLAMNLTIKEKEYTIVVTDKVSSSDLYETIEYLISLIK